MCSAAADISLLASLDEQVQAAEAAMATLLPETVFAPLPTVPGWASVRVGNYAAAVGNPDRWPRAAVSRRRFIPDPIRVCRQAPRQQHQPGRQRHLTSGADRPRDWCVLSPDVLHRAARR